MVSKHGASAVHSFVENGTPALVVVACEKVDRGFFHKSPDLVRGEGTCKFNTAVQSAVLDFLLHLRQKRTCSDHCQLKINTVFFQPLCHFDCVFAVLPVDKTSRPHKAVLFLGIENVIKIIVADYFRKVTPFKHLVGISVYELTIPCNISAGAEQIEITLCITGMIIIRIFQHPRIKQSDISLLEQTLGIAESYLIRVFQSVSYPFCR